MPSAERPQPAPTTGTVEQSEAPAQHLDEYPMPSKELSMADVEQAGYVDGDLIPLPPEKAVEYLAADMAIYSIVDGEVNMCFTPDGLGEQQGL